MHLAPDRPVGKNRLDFPVREIVLCHTKCPSQKGILMSLVKISRFPTLPDAQGWFQATPFHYLDLELWLFLLIVCTVSQSPKFPSSKWYEPCNTLINLKDVVGPRTKLGHCLVHTLVGKNIANVSSYVAVIGISFENQSYLQVALTKSRGKSWAEQPRSRRAGWSLHKYPALQFCSSATIRDRPNALVLQISARSTKIRNHHSWTQKTKGTQGLQS